MRIVSVLRRVALPVCFTALLGFRPDVADAATILYRTDAELIASSERVVHARVLRQRTERPNPDGPIYTVSTLAVLEDFTGAAGDVIEVTELGGGFGGEIMYVGGAVEYTVGREVLVMLERGRRGLRSAAMGFSKFDVITGGGRAGVLVRNRRDTFVVGDRGAAEPDQTLQDLRTLARQVRGVRSRRNLSAEAMVPPVSTSAPFTFLTFDNSNGLGARWTQADSGTFVNFYRNSAAAAPLTSGDSDNEIGVALSAWHDQPGSSLRLRYLGTTALSASNLGNGNSVIIYEDPDGAIDDSSSILAMGGGFAFSGTGGTVNGVTFNRFETGFVIFQNASRLCALSDGSFCQSQNFSRVLEHEVGHTIGLGHTEAGQSNIMFASCCSPSTPIAPALGADDRAGLNFIYPAGAACTFSVTPSSFNYTAAASGGTVNVSTVAGCAWTATSSASFVSIPAGTGASGSGSVSYSVSANSGITQRTATLSIAGQTVSITQDGTGPIVTLDRTALQFSATSNNAAFTSQTAPQTVRLTQTGGSGTVTWTAASNQPWLVVSPASGSGTATLTVSVVFSNALPSSGTATGSIALALTGAGSSAGPVSVTLTIAQAAAGTLPFGFVDTPLPNATGVTGSIPVTGWALDDVEVARVTLCRAASGAEAAPIDPRCPGAAQIFVGDAVFIDGARTDIQTHPVYSTYPRSSRAGWGFMLLTNTLPGQGNGTYTFFIYAQDREGGTTLLGTRTITCSNATSATPFGTIDRPTQGETVSGANYYNWGWALTPLSKTIPVDGSTLMVFIDGVPVGNPSYGYFRSDIATVFPGLNNTNASVGFRVIDTTALTNGRHAIAWSVRDDAGVVTGIGSRYFTVSNRTAALPAGVQPETLVSPHTLMDAGGARSRASGAVSLRDEVNGAPQDGRAIAGRRGWDLSAPQPTFAVNASGRAVIQSEEIDRIELRLSDATDAGYTGYLRVGDELAPLPIGSQLDASTGVFTWQPGVGFVGPYDFVFVDCVGSPEGLRYGSSNPGSVEPRSVDLGSILRSVAQPFRAANPIACHRQEVRIVLNPKASGRVGPQVTIDTPTSDTAQPFAIAGWAVDLDQDFGSGIDAVHVWAYPLAGGGPVFLGAATYGGARPDVAALHGDRFKASGYGLTVEGLTHGNYDLAVFGRSTATGGFAPAKTVRITVR